MAIYAAGIALNDWFDYRDRPRRNGPAGPLPSGQVSRRFAAGPGRDRCSSLGPALAALSGSSSSVAVATLLAACVLAYDAGLKRTVLGPEVMGACRGLNLLLGMSQAPGLGGPSAWLVAGSLALFVAGVTWISRSETASGRTAGIAAGLTLENLGNPRPAGRRAPAAAVPLAPVRRADPRPRRPARPPPGGPGRQPAPPPAALREPIPPRVQNAVKTGVLSLVWLNVGVVIAVRGVTAGLPVAAALAPRLPARALALLDVRRPTDTRL